MMHSTLFLLALVAGAGAVDNSHQAKAKSPVKKVVEMLSDMLAKGKKEKQDEMVRFAAYKQFCESTGAEKTKNIGTAKDEIEQLQATIAKAQADVTEITKYVAGLDTDVATWTDDLARTTAERKKQHATFSEAQKEYADSIDAVDRALEVLEKGPGGKSVAQAAAMLQRESMFSLLQTEHKAQLKSLLSKMSPREALLQEAEDEGIAVDQPNPKAAAFEGSSGGIIELVEKIGDKFREEKRDLEKREFNAKSAFDMMQKDLNGQIKTAGMERGMKETTKGKTIEAEAQAKGDLADTSASLAEDEKFLADLDSECKTKSFDFEQRQIVREGEIEAIGKAIEIMSGDEVAGANALTLNQVKAAPVLAQLRSKTRNPVQDAVSSFLQQQADKTGSKLLALIAAKAAADPFTKVKKMIKEMIQKLMEEANEEAEHKAFCDAEMGTNKQTRDKKTAQSESLKADIEELTADIAKLASEITELGSELSALDAAVKQATNDRFEEKSKNQATIKDAQAGAEAVAKALAVLKDFYEKAATPVEQPAPQQGPIAYDNRALQILKTASGGASFVQISQHQQSQDQNAVPGAPEMEEGAYTGMGNGGVLGLMEVCQSDFEKVLSETSATEEDSVKIYEEFMADSAQDKAVKETDQKHKVAEKSTKESDKATALKDLRITQEELTAALQYYEKLKPDCEVKVMSYEEKKAAREAEIESLKEALEILSGDNIA
jgi:uncharacterized small protein (DUF1192 family)